MRPNVDENIYLVSIFLPRCIIQYLLYFQVNLKEKNFFMWLKAIYHDNAWHINFFQISKKLTPEVNISLT